MIFEHELLKTHKKVKEFCESNFKIKYSYLGENGEKWKFNFKKEINVKK